MAPQERLPEVRRWRIWARTSGFHGTVLLHCYIISLQLPWTCHAKRKLSVFVLCANSIEEKAKNQERGKTFRQMTEDMYNSVGLLNGISASFFPMSQDVFQQQAQASIPSGEF